MLIRSGGGGGGNYGINRWVCFHHIYIYCIVYCLIYYIYTVLSDMFNVYIYNLPFIGFVSFSQYINSHITNKNVHAKLVLVLFCDGIFPFFVTICNPPSHYTAKHIFNILRTWKIITVWLYIKYLTVI